MEPLITLARESGAHLFGVHHSKKGEAPGGEAILGSQAIFGAVDTILLIKANERMRTVRSIQRYGQDLEETTLDFNQDSRSITLGVPKSVADVERIARTIIASPEPWLRALVPCTLGSPIADAEIDACIDQFVTTFGSRAYRRPIDAAEAALARRVFTEVRATQTATQAWASVVQFFVQAPALLYRVERGTQTAPPGKPALVTLTPHELASRLSFLLTDSGPDEELRRAADAGELASVEQVEAQARRLMSSPRFYEVLAAFHEPRWEEKAGTKHTVNELKQRSDFERWEGEEE